MITRTAIAVLLLALSPLLGHAQPSGIKANAPIVNFKIPTFSEDGVRTSLLRGNEARYISDTQIDFVAMQYTFFKPDKPTEAETSLIAPSASVFLSNNNKHYKVLGREGVRIVRDDLDIGGTNWLFETDGDKNRHITLQANVRVVFRNMNIGNILK